VIFGTRRTPAGLREQRYPDAQQLAVALAQQLAATLGAACRERGAATLVVSGGRTPLPLFEQLRAAPLDWARVGITLADERWVDPDDPGSNERLLRNSLLVGAAAAAQFVPLKNAAPSAAAGASLAWDKLQALGRPFDVVVLGMGDDGHTASLFPQSPGLQVALDPAAAPACVPMTAPVPPHERLSLNLAALLQARRLVLHITGEHKWQVYQGALREAGQLAQSRLAPLPLTGLLAQSAVPVEVHWSP
jgi:6-phosphogluconolactonase